MARSEQVDYECDICGKKAPAKRINNEGNVYYVRPDGWGHMFTQAQRNGSKVGRKADFCGEECLTELYDGFYAEAYE